MATRGKGPRRRGRGRSEQYQERFRDDGNDRTRGSDPNRERREFQDQQRGGRDRGRGGRSRGMRGGHRPRGNLEEDNPQAGGMLQPNVRRFWNIDNIRRLAGTKGDEIVGIVFDEQAAFFDLLSNHRTFENSFKIRLVIKIIYNITSCSDKSERLVTLLAQIGSSNYAMFYMNLTMFIRRMPQEQSQKERDENFHAFEHLLHIFNQMLTICPQQCADLLPVNDLHASAVRLQQQSPRYSDFVGHCDMLKELQTQAMVQPSAPNADRGACGPKENYYGIPILPRVTEITNDSKPDLECNKVEGSYTDWNHYLSVQFRLLREDFISPLRQGICDYVNSHGDQFHRQNIRVYKRVHVHEPLCLYSGIGFQLQFDVSHLQHVQWEHSRRLIFGSLLCLSSDEFATVLFASVVKRDPKLLKEGYITVKFEGDVNAFEIEPQREFTMVESTAYFEAYRHILCRLQAVRTPPPFKAYIVECRSPKPLPPPSYLSGNRRHNCFDLTALGVKDPVQLLDPHAWPHHEEVSLDKSQLTAVQMALTQELSLIQGPPGTGKTYIGLKIVEVLLQNKQTWDQNMTSPILVVCYTNHALDQFLEGILKFDNKANIIRIGGRSKCKEMEPYMLRKIMDQCHAAKSFAHYQYKPWREARSTMKQEQRSICQVMHNVSNMSMEGKLKILNFHTLEHVMDPDHANQLRALLNHYHVTEDGKEIEFWLGIWFFASKDEDKESIKVDEEVIVTEQVALPEATVGTGGPNPDVPETDDSEELAEVDAEAILLENDRIIDGERIELEPIVLDAVLRSATKKATKPGVHHDKYGWHVQQLTEQQRKQRISKGMKSKPMSKERAQQVPDIGQLESKKRWSLYRYWANQHLHECKRAVAEHVEIYTHACEEYQEAQSELESSVLSSAAVVGMTTTGAAKYHSILHKMRPKIVIIEEAAEVLESHIVTTLTASTQQVILIGDHQQLRPKPNDYRLATEYNLEVSLFERLVKNKVSYATLEVQHRMRPEVAQLICPHIYPHLINHPDVCHYEKVRGIQHNVFFVDHIVPEDDSRESDMLSHSNVFEADFAVRLCHYFIKLGYQRSKITILTMYSGQLLKMRKMMPKAIFDGVRVSAVDDFQGEENDIIILSLVRSNNEGRIGFLKESNRVCVALSRAKMGLFVIGNFTMLREKDPPWPAIIEEMDKKGLLKNGLPLCCDVHNKTTLVSSGDDFTKVPEGGCLELCGTRLPCGHSCPRLCHPGIQDHMSYRCRKPCAKTLACGHKCSGFCYQCLHGCNPCTKKIPKNLSCGHSTNLECSLPVDNVVCSNKCTKLLPCGLHTCTERCGAPCTPQCKESVIKDLPCGHKVKASCYKPLSSIVCRKSCKEMLMCGHLCSGNCSECHMGRLHKSCQSPCGRTLPCGHNCDFPCTNECPSCSMPCGNYCNHSRCTKKCGESCIPCMENCQWKCKHFRCSKKCGEMCDRPRCDDPCTKRLKCGHPCIGLCGEKCPDSCRICDAVTVTEILFGTEDDADARFIQLEDCGHIFEVSGLDQWMDQQDSGTDSKAVEIQFKCCPKCKVSVRRSLRYGNVIKQTLHDLEGVKKQILGVDNNRNELWKANKEKLHKILLEFHTKSCFIHVREFFDKIQEQLIVKPVATDRANKKVPQCQLSLHHLNAIQYQLVNLPKLIKLLESLQNLDYSSKFQFDHIVIDLTEVKGHLISLCDFMIQDYIYEQIQADVECEFNRISVLIQGCQLQKDLAAKKCSSDDTAHISNIMFQIYYAGWRKKKIIGDYATNYRTKLTEIARKYGVGCITEQERIEIVKAIGLSKGHWFKCPNGHYYCIGECGGAMEQAKCPECKAVIGGTSHRLTTGNEHAPEMDNSRHAAWSDAANLENYDPALFR